MICYGVVLVRERHLFYFRGKSMKICSFLGHRDTAQTEKLKEIVRETVERLIIDEGVTVFLFGSRSAFNDLCHKVVTALKEKYPTLCRRAYLCRHETGCLVGTGEKAWRAIKEVTGTDTYVAEFEEIKYSERVDGATVGAYVERNEWMIGDSDCLVVYYDESPSSTRKGTALGVQYALSKGKKVYNLFHAL